jgi:hypothetical protein
MRRMLCILVITAIVLVGTVAASPPIPEIFYGSVFLNGNPAPVGTVILAKINGETRGEFATTVEGVYSGSGNFDPKLSVNATEEEINAGNATVTFFVSGVQAFQIIPFKNGGLEKVDIFANSNVFVDNSTNSTVYSSSGSSSGGSGYISGGSISSTYRSGSVTSTAGSVQNAAVISPAPTESRSSIYYNIDAPLTTPEPTVVVTPAITPQSAVTTVPTTKKAGTGPLSIVFFVASIIAVLGIIGRINYPRKRR